MRQFGRKVLPLARVFVLAGVALSRADANATLCAQNYGRSDGAACNYATYDQCRAAIQRHRRQLRRQSAFSDRLNACAAAKAGRHSPQVVSPAGFCRKNLHRNGCFDCDKVITVRRFSPALSQRSLNSC